MKKIINISLVIILCFSSLAFNMRDLDNDGGYVTDKQLFDIAYRNKVIDGRSAGTYLGESTRISRYQHWIAVDRETKKLIVDAIKQGLEKNGVLLNRDSSYYIDELNIRIYNVIKRDALHYFDEADLSVLLEGIAVISYDYNNGEDPDDLYQKAFGRQ